MSKPIQFFSSALIFLFLLAACNLPASTPAAGSQPNLAGTITAQYISLNSSPTTDLAATITAQAAKLESPTTDLAATVTAGALTLSAPAPQQTQTQPASTQTPTSTQAAAAPAASDTQGANPDQGGTTVTVSQETNCRTGPGQVYLSVYVLEPGTTAQVIGKNTFTAYWIINVPNKPGASCWLYGYFATTNGDTSGLKEYSIPSTPTPIYTATPQGPPAAVSNLKLKITCTKDSPTSWSGKYSLTWTDNSSDETGFLLSDIEPSSQSQIKLSANTTSYIGTWSSAFLPGSTPFTETVQAYNSRGSSAPQSVTGSFNCPP